MDSMLFTGRSIWTMIHGVVLGGGALLGLAAALYTLVTTPASDPVGSSTDQQVRYLGRLTVAIAILLWLTVLVGTYIDFPPYHAAPPAGLTDLGQFPKALLKSNPSTAWLHSFAMEIKENVPWITVMLATTVAFVSVRYRSRLLRDATLRRTTIMLTTICLALVAVMSVLGMFINKVAPLE